MSHYRAALIHGHVNDKAEDMVIECDAPSDADAAEILYTAANRRSEVPSGVQVIEPLKGLAMTVGDVAVVVDLDVQPPRQVMLKCDLSGGWQNGS